MQAAGLPRLPGQIYFYPQRPPPISPTILSIIKTASMTARMDTPHQPGASTAIATRTMFCIATLVLLVKFLTRHGRGLKYPPGPPQWPLLGNTVFFSRLFKDMDGNLKKIAKDYGSLCMLWVGRQPFLIISTAETAKQLLDKVSAW